MSAALVTAVLAAGAGPAAASQDFTGHAYGGSAASAVRNALLRALEVAAQAGFPAERCRHLAGHTFPAGPLGFSSRQTMRCT